MRSYVFVQNTHGEPLMPCSPRKARLLLKAGKARVVMRTPFTIRLLYGSAGYKQPVTLGVDAGSRHVGMSASIGRHELYAAEMQPRNDVVDLLSTRREHRRSNRYRKTRYRGPRFDNRHKTKQPGWLAPSVEVKIQEHVTAIKNVMRILPVTLVRVETAEFDTQRLKAMINGTPLPAGTDYQKGEQYDEYNTRQYVLHRDNYTCQCCGKSPSDKNPVRLHMHHLETRKTGGNAPDNLITLCEACHKAYHAGKVAINKKRGKPMRDAAFMGIMRKSLVSRLRNELSVPVEETYGYITKYLRETNNIAKSHTADARCISNHPKAEPCADEYVIKPVRRHNRQIHKANYSKGGVRKRNQCAYVTKGYRLWDKVLYSNKEYLVTGRRTRGYFILKTLTGDVVRDVNYKKLRLLENARGYLIERKRRNLPLTTEVTSAQIPAFR